MDTTNGRLQGYLGRDGHAVNRRPAFTLSVIAAAMLFAGCTLHSNVDLVNPPSVFRGDSSTIQVVSTVIAGKNVFIPGTIVVTSGGAQSLSIFNTTGKAHGFTIPDLDIELILMPGVETLVPLPSLEGGRVHRIQCHLHPAHRNATLVVLPGS